MSQGIIPTEFKSALLELDPEILEAQQLLNDIVVNNLDELYQSAYKEQHSTETALLKVQNDILCVIDNKECVLLVLLDLSAEFDTIDYQTLLTSLEKQLEIKGSVLDWFRSYLSNRNPVSINRCCAIRPC